MATGGTVATFSANGANYTVHVFTSSGTFTVTDPGLGVQARLIGGGGGGGNGVLLPTPTLGGGGGAGGFVSGFLGNPCLPGDYPVVVGNGGNPNTPGGQSEVKNTDNTMVLAGGGGGGGGCLVINYNNAGDNDFNGCGGDGIDPPDGAASKNQGCGGGACSSANSEIFGGYGMYNGADSFVETLIAKAGAGGGVTTDAFMGGGGEGITFTMDEVYFIGGGGASAVYGVPGGGGGGVAGDDGVGGNAEAHKGAGGGGGDAGYAGGNGSAGIVLIYYLTPVDPGAEVEYFEPHQLRSPSGRASNIFRHVGRGLPNYQTAWMDSLVLNGIPNPEPPPL